MMYWHASSADVATVLVARLPTVSRFVCLHRWSMAFNSGVAFGRSRTSIPSSSAHARLTGDLCCDARSSNSTMFQPRQCDRTIARNVWWVSLVHSSVISRQTSPLLTLIAPWRIRLERLPVIGTRTCSPTWP